MAPPASSILSVVEKLFVFCIGIRISVNYVRGDFESTKPTAIRVLVDPWTNANACAFTDDGLHGTGLPGPDRCDLPL